jgi:hypothetical protein
MVTWVCPHFTAPSREEVEIANTFYSTTALHLDCPEHPIDAAGMELGAVLMCLRAEIDQDEADNDFWKRKCQAVLLRPAVEPIAYSYWSKISSLCIDEITALKVASAMVGGPLVYRKGPGVGKSAKGDVQFPALDDRGDWLAKLASAAQAPALAAALPVFVYAQTIMTHPFSDGNGRFARLLVHAALARCAGFNGPKIALAPAFYRRAEAFGAALTRVSEQGDWSALHRVFFSTLSEALEMTRALHRRRRAR